MTSVTAGRLKLNVRITTSTGIAICLFVMS